MQICMKKIPLCLSSAPCVYLQSLMQIFCFYSQYFFPPIHNSFTWMREDEYNPMSECNNLALKARKKLFKIKSSINFIASIMKSWLGHFFN